jgi:predicted ATPase
MNTKRKTPQEILQWKYQEKDRYQHFGNIITRMLVNGFRCHQATEIDIRSAVTAFCGLNGTGKSTLIQLAATAYINTCGKSFWIKDFFVKNPKLDKGVFTADTFVRFDYCQPANDSRHYAILERDRRDLTWTGQARRPSLGVYFAGVSHYVPMWERPTDFIFRYADKLVVTSPEEVAFKRTGEILGLDYSRRIRHTVQYKTKSDMIRSVGRGSITYSETNMGFGEARIQAILDDLEQLPNQSLILFEEPETSLHPKAQRRMGEYLIELASERGHQVLLTTHSDWLLDALPPESLIFLQQTPEGLRPLPGLHTTYACGLVSEGDKKALTVLVEDDCARDVLAENIRLADPNFLSVIRIVPAGYRDPNERNRGGGHDAIRRVMDTLRLAKLRLAAVLDGDQKPDPEQQIFTLPGTHCPEEEILSSQAVEDLMKKTYLLSLNQVWALIEGQPHQSYFAVIAEKLALQGSFLRGELARQYARGLPPHQRTHLVEKLKKAAG